MSHTEAQIDRVSAQLTHARNELNNMRKSLYSAKAQHKIDIEKLQLLMKSTLENSSSPTECNKPQKKDHWDFISDRKSTEMLTSTDGPPCYSMKPIGFVRSLHRQKNGTPRQGALASLSRGCLQIKKDVYNNPSHSLEGLKDYSHVWLIYVFHKNTSEGSHAKIAPPRLDGSKLGVFATRSPHRPNAIGLTLAELDRVENDTLQLSGIDLLDGTPIIDIKPFIPLYDSPIIKSRPADLANEPSDYKEIDEVSYRQECASDNNNEVETNRKILVHEEANLHKKKYLPILPNEDALNLETLEVSIPQWINAPKLECLKVIFNPIAEEQIQHFSCEAEDPNFKLEYLKSKQELKFAISSVLSEDPRSTYRRQKCSDRLYFFTVDSAHITSCFFNNIVEVLRVCPLKETKYL